MSKAIQAAALELLWKQWTAVGVAGVASVPTHAVDLEAMIVFTPFVAELDPRLADESLDWCLRIGKKHIALSRLRQLQRRFSVLMPDSSFDLAGQLFMNRAMAPASTLAGLSKKSRPPSLDLPCLIQRRCRCVSR